MNRRRSTRVTIRRDCQVLLPHGERVGMTTENISRDGMLLRWDTSRAAIPRVGDMLIVEVDLPEQEGFERRCIRCQSTVARMHLEEGGTQAWVGLSVHAMDFKAAGGFDRPPLAPFPRREHAV
jgi:PilZ domain